MVNSHPRAQLIDELNHPLRLSIMAALTPGNAIRYSELRDLLEIDNPTLSKQLAILSDAGLVERQRWGGLLGTYVMVLATNDGRRACAQHIQALRDIVALGDNNAAGGSDEGDEQP